MTVVDWSRVDLEGVRECAGTRTCYNEGCREDACTAANTEYLRKYRASLTPARLARRTLPTCVCLHGKGRHNGPGQWGMCRLPHCECSEFEALRGDPVEVADRGAATRKISDEEIREAVKLKLSDAEIAARFDCSLRGVSRAKRRARIARQNNRPFTKEEIARAKLLSDEGMPLTWVAEDLKRPAQSLQSRIRPGESKDWKAVWQQIRKNPALLELHYEFAPKGAGQNSELATETPDP